MSLYANLQAYLSSKVTLGDMDNVPPRTQLLWFPGPRTREEAADNFDPTIILTVGGGPGYELEQTYDRVMVYTDVAGMSTDYDSAEKLSDKLDRVLTGIVSPINIVNNTRLLSCVRSGGRPANIAQDQADRWHFGCAYVLRVRSTH